MQATVESTFDPHAPRNFKSSCVFDNELKGHVYSEKIITDTSFPTSHLLSIQLSDIATVFALSTECRRQIENLLNTAMRDHRKIAKGTINRYRSSIL